MSSDVRELIICEAKRLFFQHGFRRVTMDEIAARLRISKKTIYELFPSKEDLVRAVVLSILMPKAARMSDLMEKATGVAELFAGAVAVFHTLGQEISEPMLGDMRTMPEIWREIEERRLSVLSHLGAVIERGKERGEVRADLNTDLFLHIFMQTVSRIANPAMMLELNLRPSDLAEQVFRIFFYGILTNGKRGEAVS